jgi:hypothetical protein
VAAHVAMCDVCQRVKAEHQRLARLLHPLKIPEWKWEEIGMDFIWVIVDRLTKVAHFIPVKTTYKGSQLAELYMARIVSAFRTRGVPGPTSKFVAACPCPDGLVRDGAQVEE